MFVFEPQQETRLPGLYTKVIKADRLDRLCEGTRERDRIEKSQRNPELSGLIRAEWKRVKKGEINVETALDNVAKLMETAQTVIAEPTIPKNNPATYLP